MPDLTTLANVKQLIGIDDDNTGDDALIQNQLIPAASLMIEGYCKTIFGTLQTTIQLDAMRPYLYGNRLYFRTNVLQIDNFVVNAQTTLTSAVYDLLPYLTPPYDSARLKSGQSWQVTDVLGAFVITGTLGTGATVPADVQLAATELTKWLYDTRDNKGAIFTGDGATTIPKNAPSIVFNTLDTGRYVKDYFYA